MNVQVLKPLYWDRLFSTESEIDSEIFAQACSIWSLEVMDYIISREGTARVVELYKIAYSRLDIRSQNFWNICFNIERPLTPAPSINTPIFDRLALLHPLTLS